MIVDLIRETEEMREGIDLDLPYLPGRDPDHRYPDEELDLQNQRAGVEVLRESREPYHDTVSQYLLFPWIRKYALLKYWPYFILQLHVVASTLLVNFICDMLHEHHTRQCHLAMLR